MSKILEISDLTVKLPQNADRLYAIKDINIAVNKEEIVCVVGESGSGKSVTAFTVMGLHDTRALTPVAGSITLDGEDILNAPISVIRDRRGQKMSMIFQEPMTALNPVMRVGEQISEMLEIHTNQSQSERKKSAIKAMQDVNLPNPDILFASYPHQLSGGQRQRVMIAMALVLEPVLLIADEPTTALDVTTQAQILSLIKDIQKRRGMGVLFITHDFGVVSDIADRVIVMQDGLIVEQGPATEVLESPTQSYTKMLIDSVPSMSPPKREKIQDQPIIMVNKLNKTYGKLTRFGGGRVVHAVKDVSFDIKRGETTGIVGESGSGKSSVARCIIRLIDPDDGNIVIESTDIAKLRETPLRPIRRDIQIVFQDPYRSLNPRRKVGLSIIEGPMNFGVTESEATKRAKELMRVVGLEADVLDRYPHQFSGGQRQRICIARALAMEPKILVADEPVSALDVSVQSQVLDLLNQVKEQFGLAILFITHDLRVAAQVCNNILVMNQGEIIESGSTSEIYKFPQHTYTKALLAAAPGNSFFKH